MLEVDDGPELGAELAIIEVPRLVVRPISEVRGIPVDEIFVWVRVCLWLWKMLV